MKEVNKESRDRAFEKSVVNQKGVVILLRHALVIKHVSRGGPYLLRFSLITLNYAPRVRLRLQWMRFQNSSDVFVGMLFVRKRIHCNGSASLMQMMFLDKCD